MIVPVLSGRLCSKSAYKSLLQSHFQKFVNYPLRAMSDTSAYDYDTVKVSAVQDFVLHVELNRPESRNAMNKTFWREFLDCFRKIKDDKDCRSVILSGAGKVFSAGIDFTDVMEIGSVVTGKDDVARKALFVQAGLKQYQDSFTAVEECRKPVIVTIHGACIGAGVNLISACDMRYCTQDAYFSVREVELGLAADLGVLQRLPKSIGNEGLLREYIYTCEKINAAEAKDMGIVSRIFPDKEKMMEAAKRVAGIIAIKSPVAVQGSKVALNYSRDHSVREGLEFMTLWNMTMLQSEDLMKAAEALITRDKKPPRFSKL